MLVTAASVGHIALIVGLCFVGFVALCFRLHGSMKSSRRIEQRRRDS